MSPLTLLILYAVQFASAEFLGSNGSCDFEDDTCGYESDPNNDPWIVNLQEMDKDSHLALNQVLWYLHFWNADGLFDKGAIAVTNFIEGKRLGGASV
ncbi:hypothetical protein scyTo_0002399 [Scyliorhinus torazame]|uniref:MAM domain-containing protein n=1 Tax=Scyliorhinus torazame TaxID=75743 RepID=A0A401PJB6_SCYTO|nr:hypothetical protein [Scyliorhinus torazame]